MEQTLEKYLEETILEYLRRQIEVPEYDLYADQGRYDVKRSTSVVDEIVADLLDAVDKTILLRPEYQKTEREHHQYTLFDLHDVIPDFYIDEEIMKKLCFRETLIIANLDERGNDNVPKYVGGLCLNIELAEGLPTKPKRSERDIDNSVARTVRQIKQEVSRSRLDDGEGDSDSDDEKLRKYGEFLREEMTRVDRKFLVHLSSEFDIDGRNAGSRIVAWVDKDFHTLEERRREFVQNEESNINDQIIYFALQESKYYINHQSKFKEANEDRKYYPFSKSKDLIGEGSNFLLMRYLAVTKYQGTFELSTIYINGDMCRNIYECQGPRKGFINKNPVEVCKIYRTVIEECGITHSCVTVMSVHGMIVSQEWEGCAYILQINPLAVTIGIPTSYGNVPLKKVWQTDMELTSKYLDCKTEAELKMKTYVKDHPEVQDMIADYIQSILLLKPETILPFTYDYFTSFDPFCLPVLPYFDGNQDNKNRDNSNSFW